MAVKSKKPHKKQPVPLIRANKMAVWLKHFLNDHNPLTFMNQSNSARQAGYQCRNEDDFDSIGYQNYRKLQPKIVEWLDEYGFSEPKLKLKAASLIDAKETKFEKIKGTINPGTLPGNVSVVTTSDIHTTDADGAPTTLSGETLLSIGVNALETQRKTLDMAFRVRGMYAPEKHAVLTKGDLTVHVETGSEVRTLLESVASAIFGRKED